MTDIGRMRPETFGAGEGQLFQQRCPAPAGL